ncbi:hypothetical protein A2334_03490 [Candidatus Roizmanbacteria bacterium RIFOXYB2_FULL_38_10]|uniref:DUF1508 domain-containing protein n=1 Tax=Candidatus Roizmanbacteria bacterium RIFOXYD1_FULL_38_12 TaxID=1802093 RepID=A0A1F7L171_9BACT|nr:MAG: hypothetical protein A3K47_03355 [Candidatus Roizmanbacteria bacterium RIFOXYA2_FULL_38_14]OGK63801.1 MAG: hypothetical protein A3K27_03355 [Candidatus Roizmanbacteria bacterium RIFOXYA1_FULL_37_12]OGK65647.1 MAG: hypothetical protein A3K38_03355 [Candidatus Roizmanbacteria bacterium RIFOXYB1_FULL_40_23]OGK67465.1 MAG: hypothetical protein A2334_03490 [Candidatus Roizmanbacteria bacterium RIFOXYB2_FULL_38_10]OGK70052.1 MAG: hypothetical protein A3K21_03360 [Candidatus Roizmanbacteria ba
MNFSYFHVGEAQVLASLVISGKEVKKEMVRFQIYVDRAGEYRWRLIASNNREVAWSEGYTTKQAAVDSANWVKQYAPSASIYDLT